MSNGPVIVVTGATRGIGLGLARELLARGARVVICGRSADSVAKGLAELGGGDRVSGMPADVSKRADQQALWDHAVATFGRVDHWINNAGLGISRRPLEDLEPGAIDAIVATNMLGVIHGTAVALTGMKATRTGGRIWNMEGFGSGGQKAEHMAVYGATKRGVSYFTDAMAKDVDGTQVSINHLSPGIVKTDLLMDDYEGQPEAFEKAKRIFNILGDEVTTVTPYLAEGVLKEKKNGARVAWLTQPKAAGRFFGTFVLRKKRDLFADQQG